MNKESYWERRQEQNMYEYMEDADKTADQISVLYLKSSQHINKSLDKIFERYRTIHRLSETEALNLLNTMQDKTSLAELRRSLKEGDGDKKELVAMLEAPAYAARMERLEHLMGQIDQIMTEIYLQEKQISTSHYIELAQKSYYHTRPKRATGPKMKTGKRRKSLRRNLPREPPMPAVWCGQKAPRWAKS